MKLTKRTVATAPTGFTWDEVLPGFGIRVLASGRRTFVVRFRTAAGTDRTLVLGTAEELHPEDAREMARKIKADVRQGKDPGIERRQQRAAPRLADLRNRFMDEHAAQKKPGTRKGYETLWRLHLIPTLGNPAVADISESDVLRIRSRLADRPITANRALEVLSKAFNLAERWRWRPGGSNPCRFVEAFPERATERILEPEEVAAIWRELDAEDILPSFRAMIRLLVLTGCRSGEWRLARWSWVDIDGAMLRLPDSKTGARTIPLAPDVVEILRGLPRSSVYVLPAIQNHARQTTHPKRKNHNQASPNAWRFPVLRGTQLHPWRIRRRTRGSSAGTGESIRRGSGDAGHGVWSQASRRHPAT
jgi:integrase